MDKVRDAVDTLLIAHGEFRNRELARLLRLSRQRTTTLLAVLVDSDELRRDGRNRGAKYIRGPGWGDAWWGVARRARPNSVWAEMAQWVPEFAYVALAGPDHPHLRTRRDARRINDSLAPKNWIVFDFAGVASATSAFLDDLLQLTTFRVGGLRQPINMAPEIATKVDMILARAERASTKALPNRPTEQFLKRQRRQAERERPPVRVGPDGLVDPYGLDDVLDP